jgi:hypothetical protein
LAERNPLKGPKGGEGCASQSLPDTTTSLEVDDDIAAHPDSTYCHPALPRGGILEEEWWKQ